MRVLYARDIYVSTSLCRSAAAVKCDGVCVCVVCANTIRHLICLCKWQLAIHIGRMFHFCNRYYNILLLVSVARARSREHPQCSGGCRMSTHSFLVQRMTKKEVYKTTTTTKKTRSDQTTNGDYEPLGCERDRGKNHTICQRWFLHHSAFFSLENVMMQLPDKNAIFSAFFFFPFFRWRSIINGNWNIWTVQCWAEIIFDIYFNSSSIIQPSSEHNDRKVERNNESWFRVGNLIAVGHNL